MSLVWNADLAPGDLRQWGGWEYAGTQKGGVPPLSDRVTVGPLLDGYAAPPGVANLLRVRVLPGDQYGGSSGWRCIARQYEPLRLIPAGSESWFVWAQLVPAGYSGDANVWVAPLEVHQSHIDGQPPAGPAPCNIATWGESIDVRVSGGKDVAGGHVDYVKQSVLAGYEHERWQVLAMRYRHNPSPFGAFELWHFLPGEAPEPLIDRTGIGTIYEGTRNYVLFGVYRDQTGVSESRLYLAGVREYSTAAEAFAWAQTLAGSAPPPPPPPAIDLHALASKIDRKANPNIRAFADGVAQVVQPK